MIGVANGQFWLYRVDGYPYGTITYILGPTVSPFLGNDGVSKRLEMIRVGSTFNLYVNGQVLGSVSDSTYNNGTVDLAIEGGGPLDYRFDNFYVSYTP
jgi:hypothetical protein